MASKRPPCMGHYSAGDRAYDSADRTHPDREEPNLFVGIFRGRIVLELSTQKLTKF